MTDNNNSPRPAQQGPPGADVPTTMFAFVVDGDVLLTLNTPNSAEYLIAGLSSNPQSVRVPDELKIMGVGYGWRYVDGQFIPREDE